ncbi:hypothetical protein KKB99_00105, partial [bacterium]|nr:hypothetical protein [bacterium]MBU1024386.1 hypothetical protein [bacterium]
MRFASILLTTLSFLVLTFACSSNKSNPITSGFPENTDAGTGNSLPVIAFDNNSAIGLFGIYSLEITPDMKNAKLFPVRFSSLGESFIVSGGAFFTIAPCPDCLELNSLALFDSDSIQLGMSVKHPFPKGNLSNPPTAINRRDLDVFDLALVLNPIGKSPVNYPQIGESVATGILDNADGYTKELETLTGSSTVIPYKICYESANNNRFEMGTGFQSFDLVVTPGTILKFNIYLTMGYGASAKKPERLNPTYYVPEFNRKAAWKVDVTPPVSGSTWLSGDPVSQHDVLIDIYDWNHGVIESTSYPDPLHTDRISSNSDVSMVELDVPGMTSAVVVATTTDSTSNGWDDPVSYTASFANENSLPPGEYTGLVKVTDSRIPASPTENDFGYGWGITWDCDVTLPRYDYGAVVDNAGSIYNSGEFIGTFDFDPGQSVDLRSSAGGTSADAFLRKLDSGGNLIWAVTWGAGNAEYDSGLTLDNSANVYAIGTFDGVVDFDPGAGSDIHTSYGENDVYLSKFDTNGQFLWAQTWGSDYLADYISGVAVTDTGFVCVSGTFTGMTDFMPGPSQDLYISYGLEDAYLSFFDSTGNYLGVRVWGGFGNESVINVDVDSLGNAYVLGTFEGVVDFNPDSVIEDWHNSINANAPFICKYDSAGNYLWTITWGTATGWCKGMNMEIDNSDNIYVAGIFDELVDLNPGPAEDMHFAIAHRSNAFFSKLDSNGNYILGRSWGGLQADAS